MLGDLCTPRKIMICRIRESPCRFNHAGFRSSSARRAQVLVLEGRGHAVDLGRAEAKICRLLAPRRNSAPNFPGNSARALFIKLKITGNAHCQPQRRCPVIEIDGRCERTRLDVGGDRVEVIGRCEAPAVRACVQ